ncbi:sigma-54 interaction domain-containing protein [Clostridiisalibacter paucivorans]|uniref:sigma-54 interaction domain-containing protein n=1 Tax=Clostridiisalibacter paucivorans TaxID=408753 RepID=UPI0006872626|nr:sigma 54-interacting transcriptional regulator [Clostridiisalibacter paucivorans]
MLSIQEVKFIAKKIVKATTKILNDAQVLIVDQYGNYMALDESYRIIKGTNEWKPYIDEIIRRKEVIVIDNPGFNVLCKGCRNEGKCPQTLEITVPFNMGDVFIGYMSIVTFSDEMKHEYLQKKDQIIDYLNSMIDLMVSAAQEHVARRRSDQMFQELNTIINSMHYGVVDCDLEGRIKCTNNAFRELLGIQDSLSKKRITDLVKSKAIDAVIENHQELEEQESPIIFNGKLYRMLIKAKVIKNKDGATIGFIFSIRDAQGITSLVYDQSNKYSHSTLDWIIGQSDSMEKLKKDIANIATSTSTVLIRGETGTGKELVARAIHSLSERKEKPFVTINCAAIPDNLLESELFGYEDGAFTGGRKGGKTGLFEIANGGTIFLDEIGDMPLHLQVKLLRVLQEREIVRIGGYTPTELDIRVISATHQNLDELIKNHQFRMDLYYRLNIIPINIPPLRNRLVDLKELVVYFIDKYNMKLDKHIVGVESSYFKALNQYPWPGNVRELENAIEYAINIETSERLTDKSLIPKIAEFNERVKSPQTLKERLSQCENKIIQDTLEQYKNEKNNIMKVANLLGISRASLYRKVKKINETNENQ